MVVAPAAGAWRRLQSAYAGLRQHGLQQHVAAGLEMVRLGRLALVVTDAAGAGHEDHRGGRMAGHIDGVVSGAADDVHVRNAYAAAPTRTAAIAPGSNCVTG